MLRQYKILESKSNSPKQPSDIPPTAEELKLLAQAEPQNWPEDAYLRVHKAFPSELRPKAIEALHYATPLQRKQELVDELKETHPLEGQALFNVVSYFNLVNSDRY